MARLVRQGKGGPEAHELIFTSTSIGRGALNDIVIDDPGERRVHAEVLALGKGRYAVRDKGSASGVVVNGEPIDALRPLEDGDVVRVGPAEFAFEAAAEAPAAPRPPQGMRGGVVKLAIGTFASRIFGFLRDVVALRFFGCAGLFDAYVAGTALPNLFRRVLGEHVAENALTPTHRTLAARGRSAEARRLAASILALVVVCGAVLTVVVFLLAPWLVRVVVPGFVRRRPGLVTLTLWLSRSMMPYLLIIAVSAVFGSLLLSERRFLRYALAPLGSSVCIIVSVVLLHRVLGIAAMALGLVAGGLVQMAISGMPYLRRGGLLVPGERPVAWRQGALRKVGRTAVPVALAGMLSRLSALIDQALASLVRGTGRIGSLYAAHRLVQLPFAIFGLAVGRAAFPSLIEEASAQQGDGFSRALVRALRLNAFLMLPATMGTMLLVSPVVRLMYERGEFTPEHTALVARALFWYAAGLAAMGARTVLVRAFYARLSTRVPFYLSLFQVGANVALSVALVFTPLEHGGLALATSISFVLEAALLVALLRREVAHQGGRLLLRGLWSGLARMSVAAGGMALGMAACLYWLAGLWRADTVWTRIGSVAVPGLVGLGLYVALAALLRCEELHRLRRRSP